MSDGTRHILGREWPTQPELSNRADGKARDQAEPSATDCYRQIVAQLHGNGRTTRRYDKSRRSPIYLPTPTDMRPARPGQQVGPASGRLHSSVHPITSSAPRR